MIAAPGLSTAANSVIRTASEFAGPNHQRLIQQACSLQIFQKSGNRLINRAHASAVSFLQPDANAILQAAIFASIWLVIGIPCMLVWLGFGAAMQRVLRTDRALRIFNIAMGLLLVATVPLLLWE